MSISAYLSDMRSVALILLLLAPAGGEERYAPDNQGGLAALFDSGDEIAVRVNLTSPPGAREVPKLEFSQEGRRVRLHVAAGAGAPMNGMFLSVELPRAQFAGGMGWIESQRVQLGAQRPAGESLTADTSRQFGFRDAEGTRALTVELSAPRPIALLDEWRQRGGRSYAARIDLAEGPVDLAFDFVAKPAPKSAKLALNTSRKRYKLHGFGGNYCFQIESSVTDYTLRHLRSAWARTEMTLTEWEPRNDNDSAAETNWEYLRSQDKPGSNLRREFELMARIQKMRIPYAVSIWWLPEWMYSDPNEQPRSAHRRRVAPTQWAELLESIGSYLLYAKQQYGAEPDLFSFNEANIGVYVLFSPEEHREAIRSIGAHLEKLGLKTKMLLGDATGPNGTHVYSLPGANDAGVLKYAGAVAFHSWGGATPEQYAAWGDVAEWLNLPLLVAEVGVDAFAWRNRMYDSYNYGLREVRMYQELLLHARPQGFMQWEYTEDYSLVRVRRSDTGPELSPTARFYFLKQFSNLTPRNADALETSSDQNSVLFTAFSGEEDGKPVLTMHVANLGVQGGMEIAGLPPDIPQMRAVRTTEDQHYEELPSVKVSNGRIAMPIAARSMLTLTTMPKESSE